MYLESEQKQTQQDKENDPAGRFLDDIRTDNNQTPGQSNPLEAARKQEVQLHREIAEIEKSDKLQGKCTHGSKLHDLAINEAILGKYDDATRHFDQSIKMLRQNLPGQTDKVNSEKEFMQTLIDYGTTIVRETAPDYKKQVTNERDAAEKAFVEALSYATKYKTPLEQADLYKDRLSNLFLLTARFNTQKKDGQAENPLELAGYRREVQGIMKEYETALKLIKNEKSNDAIGVRAELTGGLAYVQSRRADFINDEFAADAEDNFEAVIKLASQYNPRADAKNETEIKIKADKFDKALITVLDNYRALLVKMVPEETKIKEMKQKNIDLDPITIERLNRLKEISQMRDDISVR